MALNSYGFILAFLPIAFIGYSLLFRYSSHRICLRWLLLMSVCFYLASGIAGLVLTSLSMGWDYLAARVLLSLPSDRARTRKLIIYTAICADILFLCYFKYFSSILGAMNPLLAFHVVSSSAYLPLGLSFLTFQKIGFLTDLQSGKVKEVGVVDFALFGLFFPKAVAGPIVRYNEFTAQLRESGQSPRYTDTAVGICLLAIGLFKETVVASIAEQPVSSAFSPTFPLEPIDFLTAWLGALGYTFQLYFEFSGYSDMALGAARLFGIKLPMNFNSPLKSNNLVEFWGRWHITLTRFLTWQIYVPVARYLTRIRIKAGRSVLRGTQSGLSAISVLIGIPTVVTLTISGIWHGSTWSYFLWGIIHGVCLSINQGWRLVRSKLISNEAVYKRLAPIVGRVLTLTTVIVAMVVFRAESLSSAWAILRGMAGLNGLIPEGLRILSREDGRVDLLQQMLDIFLGDALNLTAILLIVTLGPNSLELLRRLHPALDFPPEGDDEVGTGSVVALSDVSSSAARACLQKIVAPILSVRKCGITLSVPAAVLYAAFLAFGISAIERAGVFIYGQF